MRHPPPALVMWLPAIAFGSNPNCCTRWLNASFCGCGSPSKRLGIVHLRFSNCARLSNCATKEEAATQTENSGARTKLHRTAMQLHGSGTALSVLHPQIELSSYILR